MSSSRSVDSLLIPKYIDKNKLRKTWKKIKLKLLEGQTRLSEVTQKTSESKFRMVSFNIQKI